MMTSLLTLLMSPAITQADDTLSPLPVEPMKLGESLAYGGFSIATEATIYWPTYYGLDRAGIPPHYSQLIALDLGFAPMMGLLVSDMKQEGVTWEDFGRRMRFHKPEATDWAWAGLATGIGVVSSIGLSRLNEQITYPIPAFYDPALGPYATGDVETNLQRIYGSDRIQGNWAPAIALTVGNAISVTAEELYWRGLMLPRMEAGLGSWAWVVQGLLWAPSHGFKYWEILPLLGATLPLSALGQKTKNTTVVWATHMMINTATGVAGLYLVAATGLPETSDTAEATSEARMSAPMSPAVNILRFQGRW